MKIKISFNPTEQNMETLFKALTFLHEQSPWKPPFSRLGDSVIIEFSNEGEIFTLGKIVGSIETIEAKANAIEILEKNPVKPINKA